MATISKQGFRSLLESTGGDFKAFGRKVNHLLGVSDAKGKHYTGKKGVRVMRDPAPDVPRIDVDDFSIRALAETCLGESWDKHMGAVSAYMQLRSLIEAAENPEWTRSLFEDSGAGSQQASQFANINAFTGVSAGLLDAGIMTAYNNPKLIGDRLAPIETSKIFEGRKTIGVSRAGDVAEERLEGMPTKRLRVGERWILQPRTVENALAAEITQEAIFLELTGGQLMEHSGATGVGEWLAFRREIRIINSFIGVVQSYNYNGTYYNTYIQNGYYNNLITGNELLHEDQLQNIMIMFRDMVDPDINIRIQVEPNTVLVNKEKVRTASAIFGPTAVAYQYRDNPTTAVGPQEINVSEPFYKGSLALMDSALVFQQQTAPVGTGPYSGLGLTPAQAAKVMYVFESGPKTHVYVQNWPMRTQTAAPQQADMIDRGVVIFVKADERGVPMWKDPKRSVQSTS